MNVFEASSKYAGSNYMYLKFLLLHLLYFFQMIIIRFNGKLSARKLTELTIKEIYERYKI